MMEEPEMQLVMTDEQVQEAVEKVAYAVYAEFFEGKTEAEYAPVALLGIQTSGIPLSRRIAKYIREKTGYDVPVGTLDISMYRDDIGVRKVLPPIRETNIPFDIEGGVVILTDAILQSGRTIRAALDAVTDFGRPAMIRLATMIDRGLREFPIRADYVGAHIDAPADKRLTTRWIEYNQPDGVYAVPKVKQ